MTAAGRFPIMTLSLYPPHQLDAINQSLLHPHLLLIRQFLLVSSIPIPTHLHMLIITAIEARDTGLFSPTLVLMLRQWGSPLA